MNNQYRDNYEEIENQNEQQIYEFSEYPQIKEYYSKKMDTSAKKPKKIIVTEIFDQNPHSHNGLKLNKGYYKYNTESNSPYHYNQKNLFYQNRTGNNYYSQMNESYNVNNNMSEGYSSDFNKFKTYNSHKNIFYNSCLREEYSSPTNDRVNIRKKIYRGSQTPQPFRYNYNTTIKNFRNEENNNEPLIENFKYYEINNIKDRSNKKYSSITRVTGYSNLIPLHRRQMFYNYNDSHSIDIYRNNNINKSYNQEYNDSLIDPSTTEEIRRVEIEKKEYNIPHINSQIKEKIKEYNNIKIQRKQKEVSKNEKRKEFVIPPRKQTNEIKKASTSYTKIQKTTSITRANDTQNLNAYKRRNENNQLSNKNNLTSKNNTSIGQYQYKQRTKQLANTSRNNKSSININLKNTNTHTNTNNTSSNYSKYQRKTKELTTTKSSSNIGSYKYQTKINTENNFKNNDKIEYRKHTGRYKYKTDIDKDILNSRKNYSQSKNINKIEVVHQNKEKGKKYIQNRDNNTSSKVSSYQKTTKTSTSNYKNNNINNYKNSSTNNYKNISTNNYKNGSTNKYKNSSTNSYKNSSTNNYKNNITNNYKNNNSGNYKKRNDNYSSSRLIKETKTTTTTTSKTNLNNYENKRKNNSSFKRSDQNINKNLDQNKSIYNKYKLSQKVETNTLKNNHKINEAEYSYNSGNNENVGFIESNIVENRVYELPETEIENVSSIKKMKMSMRKIALGDNYKFYERKFLLNPIDNSYTLHKRRNERVIYGNVPAGPSEINQVEIFKKKSPKIKKYKEKNIMNQVFKKNIYPNLRDGEDNYEIYNKYIMNNYSYNNGNEIGFRDGGYENDEEINNYEQEYIYYQ